MAPPVVVIFAAGFAVPHATGTGALCALWTGHALGLARIAIEVLSQGGPVREGEWAGRLQVIARADTLYYCAFCALASAFALALGSACTARERIPLPTLAPLAAPAALKAARAVLRVRAAWAAWTGAGERAARLDARAREYDAVMGEEEGQARGEGSAEVTPVTLHLSPQEERARGGDAAPPQRTAAQVREDSVLDRVSAALSVGLVAAVLAAIATWA
jgi:hypothetical protein